MPHGLLRTLAASLLMVTPLALADVTLMHAGELPAVRGKIHKQ